MKKLVSIIIPVYNAEKYLENCLASVLANQNSNINIEILLIDDGSIDKSPEICDTYAQKYDQITVVHQKNSGQAAARNAGLDIAQGEYLAFVDADDYIARNMIERLVTELEKSNADVACSNHFLVEGHNCIAKDAIEKHEILTGEAAARESLIDKKVFTYVWDKLYKRELWKKVRFTNGRIFEDTIIIPQVLYSADKVVLVPEKLYYYRFTETGTMNTFSLKRYLDKIYAVENNLQFSITHNLKVTAILQYRRSESIRDLIDSKYYYDGTLTCEERNLYYEQFRHDYWEILRHARGQDYSFAREVARIVLFCSIKAYYLLRKMTNKDKGTNSKT